MLNINRKHEKGELMVNDQTQNGDIILANNVSMIDIFYLERQYQPLFTAVCFNPDTKKYGLRKVGFLEMIKFTIGISFPSETRGPQFFDSLH